MIWEVNPPYGPPDEIAVVEAESESAAIFAAAEAFADEYAMPDGPIHQPLRANATWSANVIDRPRIYTQI